MDNQTCSERIDQSLAHGYQICMNVVSTRLLEQSHIHFHIRIAKIAGFLFNRQIYASQCEHHDTAISSQHQSHSVEPTIMAFVEQQHGTNC